MSSEPPTGPPPPDPPRLPVVLVVLEQVRQRRPPDRRRRHARAPRATRSSSRRRDGDSGGSSCSVHHDPAGSRSSPLEPPTSRRVVRRDEEARLGADRGRGREGAVTLWTTQAERADGVSHRRRRGRRGSGSEDRYGGMEVVARRRRPRWREWDTLREGRGRGQHTSRPCRNSCRAFLPVGKGLLRSRGGVV